MRKFLILGLVLTGFIYILPLAANRLDGQGIGELAQDVLSVHAESSDSATANGEDVKITVQVDGKAQEMDLEDYVAGVVAAEISPNFPEEALKAQAVAARTYAAYKQAAGRPAEHEDADVCDDYHHCAAYIDLAAEASGRWGSEADTYENAILQAVEATRGQIVLYEDQPIIAVFCAAAGEKTESSADVWGSEVPYLTNVEQPAEEWTAHPTFWFELMPEGWTYGMGYYMPKPLTMAKLRARISRDPDTMTRLMRKLNRQREFVLETEDYKRPRSQAPSRLLEPWYRARTFTICHSDKLTDELFGRDIVEHLKEGFTFLLPYYDYFVTLDGDPDPRDLTEEKGEMSS